MHLRHTLADERLNLPRPADLVTTPTEQNAPVTVTPDATPTAPEPDGMDSTTTTAPATEDNAALTPNATDAVIDEAVAAVAEAPRSEPRAADMLISSSSSNATIDEAVQEVIEASLVDATKLAVAVSRTLCPRPTRQWTRGEGAGRRPSRRRLRYLDHRHRPHLPEGQPHLRR